MTNPSYVFTDTDLENTGMNNRDNESIQYDKIKGNILIKLERLDYVHLSKQLFLSGKNTNLNSLNLIQKSIQDSECIVAIQLTDENISTEESNLFNELIYKPDKLHYKITWKDCIKYIFEIKKTVKGTDDDTKQQIPLEQIEFGEKENFKKSILIIDDHLSDKDCAIGWFFMKNLDLMGKEKSWRIFCVQTPNEFFKVLHENAIDVVVIDHSYERYKSNPDAFDPVSLKYTARGIENMQKTIIERLKKEYDEGWEFENITIYEPLPFIIRLTNEEKNTNEEDHIRTIYKYGTDITTNLYDIRDNDSVRNEHTNSKINNWLKLRCLLKKHLPQEQPNTFVYENDNIRISIDLSTISCNINTSYLDVFKRIQFYIGIAKSKNINKIIEDANWQPQQEQTPYYVTFKKDNTKQKKIEFCGIDFYNPILLAATPLTGIQHYDYEKSIKWYKDKIAMLFSTGIGGIVLKTVYYDYKDFVDDTEKNIQTTNKPYTKVQEKSKTRVYAKLNDKTWYIGESLYNTGKTSSENLTFNEMIEFLKELNIEKEQTQRTIISVGSKSYNERLWEKIFKKLSELKSEDYSIVEINARHTIREMLKYEDFFDIFDEYQIFGDEQKVFYDQLKKWLAYIDKLAINNKKKLIVKLPFRSDLIQLFRILESATQKHPYFGIKAVTLINSIKAPYPITDVRKTHLDTYSPCHVYFQEDIFGLPQVSGSALTFLRDWAIFQASRYLKNFEVSASGGVDSIYDFNACLSLGATTVQIGTAALISGINLIKDFVSSIDINKYDNLLPNLLNRKKQFVERYAMVDKDKCIRCGTCLKTFYCDAFLNRFYKEQREKIIEKTNTASPEIVIPADKPFPIIERDLCLGCGLCAQLCIQGAINIYTKENCDKQINESN